VVYECLAQYLDRLPPGEIELCWDMAERTRPVQPALEFIERHLDADLSNAILAHACSMSDGHFIRTFRACMNRTPAQYVLECRIKAAQRLLMLTEKSIDLIATEAGFGSRHYFSRVFSRQIGVAPAGYRKEYRRGA